jgi:hypothetical protein
MISFIGNSRTNKPSNIKQIRDYWGLELGVRIEFGALPAKWNKCTLGEMDILKMLHRVRCWWLTCNPSYLGG